MLINNINQIPSTKAGIKMFLNMYNGEQISVVHDGHLMVITPVGNNSYELEIDGKYIGGASVDDVAEAIEYARKQQVAQTRYAAFQQYNTQYYQLPSIPRSTRPTSEPSLLEAGLDFLGDLVSIAQKTRRF